MNPHLTATRLFSVSIEFYYVQSYILGARDAAANKAQKAYILGQGSRKKKKNMKINSI